jgi:Tfp pilus assembly protein PilO
MPDLRQTRKKVKMALVALVLLDVVAMGVYFSPLVGSQRSRGEQLSQLWAELQQKTHEVEPLRGLDKKIPLARKEIDDFYKDRLPSEESTISAEIGKLAQQSGVKIANIKYVGKDTESVGLKPVLIEAGLSGDYLQLVRFINSLERDQLFFLVNSVVLGGEQNGVVRLDLKMETFLKTATGAA